MLCISATAELFSPRNICEPQAGYSNNVRIPVMKSGFIQPTRCRRSCIRPRKSSTNDPMPADSLFIGFFAVLSLLGMVLAWIDIRDGIIPDWLNLTIAALGLAKATIADGLLAGIEAAAAGVASGLIFWLLRRLYFGLRKLQGLGLGDVKFLAAAGIWIGLAGLPTLLLTAALTALAAAAILKCAGRDMNRGTALPFGPFLTIGLLLALIVQQIADRV
jgi:leader peptidase (prepilin peptidase) / N-methyltransferase